MKLIKDSLLSLLVLSGLALVAHGEKLNPVDNQARDLDERTFLGITECPLAHGQTFDSNSGDRFHIDCTRRYGTQVIFQNQKASLKDCINACGALPACNSVNYHVLTKTCYYGENVGVPAILAIGWASAHKINKPASTTATPSPTPTPTSPPCPAPPFATEARCPESDLQTFQIGGKGYKLWCNLINHGVNDISVTTELDWAACITKCSTIEGCVRAIWQPNGSQCFLRSFGNLEDPAEFDEYHSAHLVECPA